MSYNFEYYSGADIKSPVKPVKPILGRNPSAIEARAFADALEEYERDMDSYKENLSYYCDQIAKRQKEFEETIKFDYALTDVEFYVIWNEAYDYGHSAGMSEVYSYFDRLYNFIEEYKKKVKG